MATYRIGIGSFNLKDGAVGIGTESSGLGNLKVEGTYKTTDLDVTGVSTFTRYAGFAPDNLEIGKDGRDRTLTGEHQTTGDIVVGVNSTFTVSVGATVDIGTVPSVSIGTHFSPPIGGVEERPEVPVEGTVRFNIDSNTLEFYNGVEWRQFTVNGSSGRGIWAGGNTPTDSGTTNGHEHMMEFNNLNTGGFFQNFGNLTIASRHTVAMSSQTRGLIKHGYDAPVGNVNVLDYITIASAGDAIDFGDTTYAAWGAGTFASSTRGVVGGGTGPLNTMCYVTIATIGNALDFGDLSDQFRHTIGYASPTRGIMGTGDSPTVLLSNFDSITIASSGGGTDFGDICYGARSVSACSNTTRGVWMGGYRNSPAGGYVITEIDNTTIASGGLAIKFGNLQSARGHSRSASTNIRAVTGGGNGSRKDMESVEFASGGAAVAFSELSMGRSTPGALSDSHGGLGGY